MTRKLAVGDVFLIPVGDGRDAVGQVVGAYGKDAYYLALFDGTVSSGVTKEKAMHALKGPVILLALSTDAKLQAGHWRVVGRAVVSDRVDLPAYKEAVHRPAGYDVVDYSGKKRRPASAEEAVILPYRSIVAPVRIEKALRASLDLEPWLPTYDELRVNGQPTTFEFFG